VAKPEIPSQSSLHSGVGGTWKGSMGLLEWLMGGSRRARAHSEANQPAYAYWSCLGDGLTCTACRATGEMVWIPGMINLPEPPLRSCKSASGCRCVVVFVGADESGAAEAARFIRERGGRTTRDELDEAQNKVRAPGQALRAREHAIGEKVRLAGASEKTDPTRAVDLYREAIVEYKEIAPSADQWTWRHFPYCYNRLTMILERLRRNEEALRCIDEFRGLPWATNPTKSDSGSLNKRYARLRARVART
jgi:hypothetical protein